MYNFKLFCQSIAYDFYYKGQYINWPVNFTKGSVSVPVLLLAVSVRICTFKLNWFSASPVTYNLWLNGSMERPLFLATAISLCSHLNCMITKLLQGNVPCTLCFAKSRIFTHTQTDSLDIHNGGESPHYECFCFFVILLFKFFLSQLPNWT